MQAAKCAAASHTLEEEGKRFLRKKAARAIFKPYSCAAHGVRERQEYRVFPFKNKTAALLLFNIQMGAFRGGVRA
jgi:hypothetical protein